MLATKLHDLYVASSRSSAMYYTISTVRSKAAIQPARTYLATLELHQVLDPREYYIESAVLKRRITLTDQSD